MSVKESHFTIHRIQTKICLSIGRHDLLWTDISAFDFQRTMLLALCFITRETHYAWELIIGPLLIIVIWPR